MWVSIDCCGFCLLDKPSSHQFDVNTSMTRNPNPIWIQDNDESPSTIRNPNPTRIQDVIRNPYPTWIEDPLTYNGSPIT